MLSSYNPPEFLTPEVLAEVLAEFTWPAPYTIHRGLDGIVVRLPRCHLYVMEGFESDMDLAFLPESTGLDDMVSVGDALRVLTTDPDRVLPPEPKLINFLGAHASLDKVKNELRDLLTLLFTYFRSSLEGDFGWVAFYREHAS
jgi:hypothetical protein